MTRVLIISALLAAVAVSAGETTDSKSSDVPALLSTTPSASATGKKNSTTDNPFRDDGAKQPAPLNSGAPDGGAPDIRKAPKKSSWRDSEPVKATPVDNLRVDSILASVNGQPISLLDVVDECGKEEARIIMLYNGETAKDSIRNLRKKTLNDIIDRKLVVEDYQRDPFDIPRQNIENFIDEMSANISDGTRRSLKKKIEESGITLDDLEDRARERLIVDFMLGNLFFKGGSVTPQEAYEYYQKNGNNFAAPPRIRLEVLFLPENREKLADLVKDLQSDLKSQNSKIFSSLVALHSAAPNAKNGGDLGWIEFDKLRPEFVKTVDKQNVGFISGPVTTAEGVYFLRIKELDKGGVKQFNDVRRDITEQLQRNLREKIYKEYVDKLRKQALIRYYIEE